MDRKIDDNTLVEVWNNHRSSIGYTTDKGSTVWHTPGLMKKIRMDELYDAFNVMGGRKLFAQGALLIKDNDIREKLGLAELDKYILDKEGMEELLNNGNLEEIEEFLQYCSDMLLETFTQAAINLPIKDMNVARLITKYSATDVLSVIDERAADKETSVAVQPTRITDETGRAKRIAKE